VKDAWDSKRDILVKSGAFAIEQLTEALSASASSNKVPDGLPQNALRLCAEQVRFYHNEICLFFFFFFSDECP
jgi:hypothetical protein